MKKWAAYVNAYASRTGMSMHDMCVLHLMESDPELMEALKNEKLSNLKLRWTGSIPSLSLSKAL